MKFKPICMKHYFIRLVTCLFLLLTIGTPTLVVAQEETAAKEAVTEQAIAEEPELISPGVEIIAVQKTDGSVDLRTTVKAKINGKLRKMHSLKIHYYLVSDSAETEVGAVNADLNGYGVFNVKPEQVIANKEGVLNFKAKVNANKNMEEGVAEVSVKRAKLIAIPIAEGGVYSVQVKLVDLSSGTETAVPELTIGLYVKRMFNPLKVGEATTDETGEAIIEFPSKLPGDAKGNLNIIARLDEDENYGYLEASITGEKWGIPVSDKLEDQPRALWSAHPPLWMLITFIVLMLAVWGHYIVIVYELFRLRKERPHTAINS
jgi:hypothetical protein